MVVTGPPSSGKTRLLETLMAAKEIMAPYGPPISPEPWIRPGAHAAKVQLTFLLDQDELRRAGTSSPVASGEAIFGPTSCRHEVDDGVMAVLERYEHDPRYGKIDYFAANRSLPPPGPVHGLTSFEQRVHRVRRDPRKYAFIPRFLLELRNDPAPAPPPPPAGDDRPAQRPPATGGGAAQRPPPGSAPSTAGVRYPNVPLKKGMRGVSVRRVQERLRALGWDVGVDGLFGSETDRVVRAFQRRKSLLDDGSVGPRTWRALFG